MAEVIFFFAAAVALAGAFGTVILRNPFYSVLALEGARPDLIEPILPGDDDLFLAKTRHSIFYATPLEYILAQEEVDRIVLAGQVTEQCILYSALDAYIRHIDVAVPRDAVAHIFEDLAEASLTLMERNMHAEVCAAGECRLGERH